MGNFKPVHIRIFSLLSSFFSSRLIFCYEGEVVRIFNQLESHSDFPFESGKEAGWAAAIADLVLNYEGRYRIHHSLITVQEISDYFGVSPGTLRNKSRVIRSLLQHN
ncbi:hypothetical protein J2Z22_001680 [Paenibacillus forsythiae]|uniref:DUF6398 domain-containing protein n=1 Tax=Paenibacillus forsythiae TaxID=365616 RepID=A0ABU3H5R4_9BACL|nr:DUF6398 domain-containing protein [Paenibacillus forsythiae]MDT3426160.1 hypothetical protein [Paenibacillus forsythiae]